MKYSMIYLGIPGLLIKQMTNLIWIFSKIQFFFLKTKIHKKSETSSTITTDVCIGTRSVTIR